MQAIGLRTKFSVRHHLFAGRKTEVRPLSRRTAALLNSQARRAARFAAPQSPIREPRTSHVASRAGFIYAAQGRPEDVANAVSGALVLASVASRFLDYECWVGEPESSTFAELPYFTRMGIGGFQW